MTLMEIVMSNGAIWLQVENMFPVKSLSPQARILFSQLFPVTFSLPPYSFAQGLFCLCHT